jgi:hypothetical protein
MTISMKLTVLFGALSAAFWLASAFVSLPSNIWFPAHVGAGGRNQEFEKLVGRLRLQSRLNAVAASFAFLATAVQTWAQHQG